MTRGKSALLPLIALLLFLPLISNAKEPIRTEEGIVKKVADGDTVTVKQLSLFVLHFTC